MSARAVVIGVADYQQSDYVSLPATTNDSQAVADMLKKNADGQKNMDVKLCNSDKGGVLKQEIELEIESALSSIAQLVVIYFSGHGATSPGGDFGQLVASDGVIEMSWLMARVKHYSTVQRSTVVILDCCHSGAFGGKGGQGLPIVEIERGCTVIAAADAHENAVEDGKFGRFTRLLIDGLNGGSADLAGRVTPSTLYTHIDQAIGKFAQRPVFVTNIHTSTVLRLCTPPIDPQILRELPDFFYDQGSEYDLDPGYEFNRGEEFEKPVEGDPLNRLLKNYPVDKEKVAKLKKLQKLQGQGLVIPVNADHMYFAVIHSRSCQLTELGKHYWRLAKNNEI